MSDRPQVPVQPATRPDVLKLSRWSRASAIVLGLVGLGAGGAAVFVTHLEAGPAALIAVGLIFVLVGMGGRMPNRLRMGEAEASWEVEREAVQAFVRDVTEQSSVGHRPQVMSALADLAESAPAVAAPALKAIAYEETVLDMLGKLREESRTPDSAVPAFDLIKPGKAGELGLVDALLVTTEGLGVAVEIKTAYEESSFKTLSDAIQRYIRLRSIDKRAELLLLIMANQLPAQFLHYLKQQPFYIRQVTITGSSDMETLAGAVRNAFRKVQEIGDRSVDA